MEYVYVFMINDRYVIFYAPSFLRHIGINYEIETFF